MSVVAPIHALSVQPVHTSCVMSAVAPIHASSIQSVHTSYITSVIAPVCALPVPSIHPSDIKHQEIPDEFPSTNCGRKTHPKLWLKSMMT